MQPTDYLLTRRSTAVKDLEPPAPNDAQLQTILTAATRVPDHGKLCPWRIVVLRETGQRALGTLACTIFARQNLDATPAQLEHEQNRFHRAPLVLAILSTPILGTKPVWEQQLSAGAVCMNILHAAHMLGYGAKWLTEWVAYDTEILSTLMNLLLEGGGRREAAGGGDIDNAAIAGFIYLGTKTTETADRERPKLEDVVREW